MSCNRLKLDWTLNTSDERATFINEYTAQLTFSPNEEECEMMGNYILWGRDPDGQNSEQKGFVQLERRNSTWSTTQSNVGSLDELLETPTFNESELRQPNAPVYKTPKQNFSREEALHRAPPHIYDVLTDLFHRIDTLDLQINFYELDHGKRKNPPRDSLLNAFTPDELESLKARTKKWNQRTYLKRRHLLVELRREQYTYRDFYAEPIALHPAPPNWDLENLTLETEIPVYPLGLHNSSPLFLSFTQLCNNSQDPKFRTEIDSLNLPYQASDLCVDFRDPEQIYVILTLTEEIEDAAAATQANHSSSLLPQLLATLEYYIENANLSPIQRDILQFKRNSQKNTDIANYINSTYNKTYTANYISTIYRKKILPTIADAATYHEKLYFALDDPSNFKKCSTCGLYFLRSEDNFVHKSRAKDGFANRCKFCDKLARASAKH